MSAEQQRKPSSRSWLKNLPDTAEQAVEAGRNPACTQEAIFGWLASGQSLRQVAERCLQEFGSDGCSQTVTGLMNALSEWRPWYQQRQAIQERRQSIAQTLARCDANAKAFAQQMQSLGASAEQIAAADNFLFQAQAAEAGKEDKELWIELEKLRIAREQSQTKARNDAARLRQKDEELRLSTRRVTLLEENQSRAKAALETVKKSGGLSAETLAQIEEAARLL